eukprot:scaffold23058_cov68-Phaeocystis_antarctica.AAC.18
MACAWRVHGVCMVVGVRTSASHRLPRSSPSTPTMMSPSRSTPSVAASEWGSTRRITLRSLTSMPSPLSPRRTATVRFSWARKPRAERDAT